MNNALLNPQLKHRKEVIIFGETFSHYRKGGNNENCACEHCKCEHVNGITEKRK